MISGIVLGVILNYYFQYQLPYHEMITQYFTSGILLIIGNLFIALLKMLVVPIVFTSMVCGVYQLNQNNNVVRLVIKTLVFYLLTTCIAIALAILIALLFKVGSHEMTASALSTTSFKAPESISLKQTIIGFVPTNIFYALSHNSEIIQLIIFSMLFGIAMVLSGETGNKVANLFEQLNEVVMNLVLIIIYVAPLGIFCLLAQKFAELGFSLLGHLIWYFMTVVIVLAVQAFIVYPIFLKLFAKLNPIILFRKMYSVMVFAFSTASSNATIPVTLDVVEKKLGVKNSIASFIIPLGATINMDGTAIMQGVATVFIAHFYHIALGVSGYLTVILMATLASIGTAGVPGIGLITLTMVLTQVGLPVEGIALIIGIDRLLDMLRTAVNVTGDSVVACIVAKSENALEEKIYQQTI